MLAGLPCTSTMWGAWALGMAASAPAMLPRLERTGMGAIQPAQGLAALAGLMEGLVLQPSSCLGFGHDATPAQSVMNPFIWARLRRPGQDTPFLFASLVADIAATDAHSQPSGDPGAAQRERTAKQSRSAAPAGLPLLERRAAIAGELLALVRGMLGPEVRPVHVRAEHTQFSSAHCTTHDLFDSTQYG